MHTAAHMEKKMCPYIGRRSTVITWIPKLGARAETKYINLDGRMFDTRSRGVGGKAIVVLTCMYANTDMQKRRKGRGTRVAGSYFLSRAARKPQS